jgi:hypothetical protein
MVDRFRMRCSRLIGRPRRARWRDWPCHLYTSQGTLRRFVAGFTDVKRPLLACLDAGAFRSEMRDAMSEKNLLATGAVTAAQVRRIVGQCTGLQYRVRPMTEAHDTLMHELMPVVDGTQWFI